MADNKTELSEKVIKTYADNHKIPLKELSEILNNKDSLIKLSKEIDNNLIEEIKSKADRKTIQEIEEIINRLK